MSTLGWTLVGAAIVTGAYGFAWALCNAARIGDDALMHLDSDMDHTVDIRSARMWAELDYTAEMPYDQDVQP